MNCGVIIAVCKFETNFYWKTTKTVKITKKSNILFFIYVRLFSICWFVIVSSIGIISVATIFYEDFICHGIYLKSILLIVVILLIVLNFINCMLWTNYKIWYWVFQTNLDYKRYTLKYWICRLWTLLKNLCKIKKSSTT